MRTDSDLAQLAALRAGFGIGGCQFGIARRDPDLVPVLEGQFRFEMEVWVAMHEDLKTSRRMRLMFDWLVEGLGEYLRSSEAVCTPREKDRTRRLGQRRACRLAVTGVLRVRRGATKFTGRCPAMSPQ